ncbi:alpha/beta hydrolase family protein [Halomontanus rarus]|uniref:alpha/beta hydrolase family protein n=1 Tax=Halomontanus rarus TaxID=3034020 RepID=UPI0023E8294B|nr:acetylxylan esterase [Halovivax sp. TS33]
MDGFNDAVDGYVDVDDQLSRYVLSRADDHFANERAVKRAIDSRREFEERRECVRELFLSSVGGLPDRMADPSVETTGRLERDGYSIELLVLESRPNFHVTANCYVPDGDGPFPGVLFCCGHVDSAKGDPHNQKACIELASNGFVVLVVDPVGQGERTQYVDSETGEPRFTGSGGVFAHCYAGQKCFYAGANLARYVIHDDRCALDYLAERSDVDPDRIGVTGTSGGGIQTLYLSLVDDRIDAAAPCCSVTERREWLKTGKRIDAEQVIYGAIPRGINYDDLVTAMAPDPICVGAAASDEYFPIEGVHETLERARRIYDLYDADENVRLTVADTTHCSVYELREGVFEFLCDHLGDGEYVPRDDPSTLDESELHSTPEGSVLAASADERTIDDLIREYVAETCQNGGTVPAADDGNGRVGGDGEYAADLRRTLLETFDLDREGCELNPRFVDRAEKTDVDGLDVEHVWFKTERDPDIVVTGVLVSDPQSAAESPAVVLYEDGTEELPERTADVASLAREYGTVLVFDPRGVGAVRNRVIPIPAWVDEYDDIYGTEFKLAYDALQMESSLLEMRVYDVRRAVEFLRSETDADRVSFVGEGIGAYHALYAGTITETVERIDLQDVGPSFFELATERDVPFRPQLTAFDVVGECDLPHLTAALERRGVRVSKTSGGGRE